MDGGSQVNKYEQVYVTGDLHVVGGANIMDSGHMGISREQTDRQT